MSNKSAKERLIKLYGAECFIDKLHLRKDIEPKRYKSRGQMKRMRALTYHHILEKSKGGRATVENGALLAEENHIWFHQQPIKAQKQMNKMFQEYKKSVDCKVEFVDKLDFPFEVASIIIEPKELEKQKYNRAKVKREWQREVEEER